MIGIIGGGFGLYAWMPSLAQYYPSDKIFLESRHKEKFDKRPELQKYKDRIEWVNIYDILENVKLLVLAIPPNNVNLYLEDILKSNSIKKLIVEKPICETPEKSEQFIKAIEDKGIKICSSYLFFYTDWFKELDPNKQYEIVWLRSNDNSKDSWKHKDELGGGEIFYKIHLLALKTYLDNIDIRIVYYKDSLNQNEIIILNNTDKNYIHCSPFEEQFNGEDDRIPLLKELLFDFENNYEKVNQLMKQTNGLWKQIQLQNKNL